MKLFTLYFRRNLDWQYLYSADSRKKNVQLILLVIATIATHSGYTLSYPNNQSFRWEVLLWLYIFIAFIIVTQIHSITCYTINLVFCYETIAVAFFFVGSCIIFHNLNATTFDVIFLVMFPWLAVLFQIHLSNKYIQRFRSLFLGAGPQHNGHLHNGHLHNGHLHAG